MQPRNDDPRVNTILFIILVLLTLFTFANMASCEEPEGVGFRMNCGMLTKDAQEIRTCETFWSKLKEDDRLRAMQKDEPGTFMWYVVGTGFDPGAITEGEDDTLFVHASSHLCLEALNGLCFAVWMQADMVLPSELGKKVDEMVDRSLEVYGEWLSHAIITFENLCPDPGPCEPTGQRFALR